ncbi:P2Y purinoceptor 13-like [Perca fluviatilis]|uniref:P2Y purinoceptor 13-like n=1 Tax=Perca fluviatilis TaxID=8168 RepID=UPI00196610C0|nr:P2Y purinoceptor 13-like [Perca fluviatilis]
MDDDLYPPFDSHQQSAVMTGNQTSSVKCDNFIYNPDVVPALYLLMLPIALLLNSVAAWVSLHLKSTSTFVVYLKNLVAADIIMTLVIPIKTARDLPGFISLDRFFKIMMPHSKFSQNLTFSKLMSGTAWVVLIGGAALPNIILSSNTSVANMTEVTSCMQLKGPAGLKFHEKVVISQNVFFWLVSVVIAVCYICIANKVIQSFRNSGSSNNQGQQKIHLRVFLVVIVFVVSFGPYHIISIPYTFEQVRDSSYNGCSYFTSKLAKELSLWLASTNVCMIPLLYVFLCREFKEKLVSMMKDVSNSFQVALAGKAKVPSPQSGD